MAHNLKNCPFCGKEIRAKAFVCKHCKKTVGEAEDVPLGTFEKQASFACEHCQRVQLVPVRYAGGRVRCTFCAEETIVPQGLAETPAGSGATHEAQFGMAAAEVVREERWAEGRTERPKARKKPRGRRIAWIVLAVGLLVAGAIAALPYVERILSGGRELGEEAPRKDAQDAKGEVAAPPHAGEAPDGDARNKEEPPTPSRRREPTEGKPPTAEELRDWVRRELQITRSFEADRIRLGRLSLEERRRLAVESRNEIAAAQGEARYRAIDTLGVLGDRAATVELAKIVADPSDATAQWLAARALGRIADRRGGPALRRATQSPDERVRMWAYWAWVRIAAREGASPSRTE